MSEQLGLFAAAAPPAPAPRAAVARATPKPAPARPSKAKRASEPAAPPVVVSEPQLPPLGAFAKIDGRWHQWRKLGLCGDARGWEIVRPPNHSAHLRDEPPRLGSNGWIKEPHPKPAEITIGGVPLRIEWSEFGFSVHHAEDGFMRHFGELAATGEDARSIIEAELLPQLQELAARGDAEAADAAAVLTGEAEAPDEREEWRFEWRGLAVIGTRGPCFQIDKAKHPEGTLCWSPTGFRSFCSQAWTLAGQSAGRTLEDWSGAILDAYFAAPAKDGNGLGGKLVPWAEVQPWMKGDDDDAPDAPEPAPAPPKDAPPPLPPVLQTLVDAGLISRYNAVSDATLRDPKHEEREAPWNAPSRLFQFPCSLHLAKDEQPARLLIWSARIAEHPYVREVAAACGLEPVLAEGSDAWGFSQAHGTYHHAVDLISAGQWRQLLELHEFSDDSDILCAVNYGLDYGHLSAKDAATLLNAVGLRIPKEPTTPLDALRAVDLATGKDEKGKERRLTHWMVGPGTLANTWGRIAGMERGWFQVNRQGFIRWTDKALVEQRNLKAAAGEAVAPAPVAEGCLL